MREDRRWLNAIFEVDIVPLFFLLIRSMFYFMEEVNMKFEGKRLGWIKRDIILDLFLAVVKWFMGK